MFAFVLCLFIDEKRELPCTFYGKKRHLTVRTEKNKNNLLSNVLSVRNCNDVQLAHFSASTSNLLMQTISLPLGSLLAMVLGHIILYENGGLQALAVRQTSTACCLSLQLFWKSAWISFGFFLMSSQSHIKTTMHQVPRLFET